jgi:hypothetical protein
MKTIWKIVVGLLIMITSGVFIYQEVFKEASSLDEVKADMLVEAVILAEDYETDEARGNEKYLGKILQVSGEISEIEGGAPLTVVLKGTGMTQIRAELHTIPDQLPVVSDIIEVRGSCSGLLLDVVLHNAVILHD